MKRAFGVLLVVLALGSCHARENEFYEKIFPCDPNGPADSCGTTKSGAAMVCFPGKQWRSMDFCAERCESDGPIDDNFVCAQSARLQKCDPSSPSSGCPTAMGCAGVGNGDGLCMPCQGAGCATIRIPNDGSVSTDGSVGTDGSIGGIACDSHNPCRPTSSGKNTVCYAVKSLGGMDFCAEECDPGQEPSDPGFTCADPGALLQRCHPDDLDDQDDQADCPPEFACYRTRLSENKGLCLWKMKVCASDNDCSNDENGRTICASSLVETIFAGIPVPVSSVGIHLDHLNCVHRFCNSNSSDCQATEGCLGKAYASPYADLCVPQCAGASPCPPNYSCSLLTSGVGSPSLCLPGILGVRCTGTHCISGTCDDTGAGFSVCATPCSSNDDCKYLNSASDTFVCVSAGPFQHCVTPRPFHGANCYQHVEPSGECAEGEMCSFVDGLGDPVAGDGHGECRVKCKADGTCDPRGGLPHTCVSRRGFPNDRSGGCFPGELGVGCQLATECISGLSCLAVRPEPDLMSTHDKLCTIPCGVDGGTDADADLQCDVPTAINHNGYCGNGFCRGRRIPGDPCVRDRQCNTLHCGGTLAQCQ